MNIIWFNPEAIVYDVVGAAICIAMLINLAWEASK